MCSLLPQIIYIGITMNLNIEENCSYFWHWELFTALGMAEKLYALGSVEIFQVLFAWRFTYHYFYLENLQEEKGTTTLLLDRAWLRPFFCCAFLPFNSSCLVTVGCSYSKRKISALQILQFSILCPLFTHLGQMMFLFQNLGPNRFFFFVIKGFNRTNRESVFSIQLTKGRSCDSLEAFKIRKCREKES